MVALDLRPSLPQTGFIEVREGDAMRIILAGFLVVTITSAWAEDYCPDMHLFTDHRSDEVYVGNYEAGYTSGYHTTAQGDHYFRYCIENLSDQTMFQFLWNGPRPRRLFQGRLAYGRDMASAWFPSDTGPDDIEMRDLGFRNGRGSDYTTEAIETFFRRAERLDRARPLRVQAVETFNLSSWEKFTTGLQNTLNPDNPRLRRTAGVTFNMPSDPAEWESYIEGSEDSLQSPPVPMQVFMGLEYDFASYEVSVITSLGLNIEAAASTGATEAIVAAITLEFPGLAELGFKIGSASFSTDRLSQTATQLQDFRMQSVANFEAFLGDERPVGKSSFPVTVLLNNEPIFEVPFQALLLPEGL